MVNTIMKYDKAFIKWYRQFCHMEPRPHNEKDNALYEAYLAGKKAKNDELVNQFLKEIINCGNTDNMV